MKGERSEKQLLLLESAAESLCDANQLRLCSRNLDLAFQADHIQRVTPGSSHWFRAIVKTPHQRRRGNEPTHRTILPRPSACRRQPDSFSPNHGVGQCPLLLEHLLVPLSTLSTHLGQMPSTSTLPLPQLRLLEQHSAGTAKSAKHHKGATERNQVN
jgi:hypothetical protein